MPVARATTRHHPARRHRAPPLAPRRAARTLASSIPRDADGVTLRLGDRTIALTNLRKPYFPDDGISKGDLLRYYATVAPALLPHLRDRALVMLRWPNGIAGESFYMKRAPQGRPPWMNLCAITHASGNVIDFVVVQDVLALLWVINLGSIDVHPWYARCDDVDRPDWLHFDLDPGSAATFEQTREVALAVRTALAELGLPASVKTSGGSGLHVYVPIVRGPDQKTVWHVARDFAHAVEARHPRLVTTEYALARRPANRVLVDYNQNAWGRTLASIYSVRPRPGALVSTPVTWDEVDAGFDPRAFDLRTVPARLAERGDLWKPLLSSRGRARLRDAA